MAETRSASRAPGKDLGPPVTLAAQLVERTYKAVKLRVTVPPAMPGAAPRVVTAWVPFALATWAGKGKWTVPEVIAREKGFV